MVWCGTANPSVLTFNRMWAIQRELAVMNVLFGAKHQECGAMGTLLLGQNQMQYCNN